MIDSNLIKCSKLAFKKEHKLKKKFHKFNAYHSFLAQRFECSANDNLIFVFTVGPFNSNVDFPIQSLNNKIIVLGLAHTGCCNNFPAETNPFL